MLLQINMILLQLTGLGVQNERLCLENELMISEEYLHESIQLIGFLHCRESHYSKQSLMHSEQQISKTLRDMVLPIEFLQIVFSNELETYLDSQLILQSMHSLESQSQYFLKMKLISSVEYLIS